MSSVEQLHQKCLGRLQALAAAGGAGGQARKRGGLFVVPPELTMPDATFYATWYLLAGALSFLGSRALERMWRVVGWKDATQKAVGDVHETLQSMEPDLRELIVALKGGKAPRTDTLARSVEVIGPALQELTDRLSGQVSFEQATELQGEVGERLHRLDVLPPLADRIGYEFSEVLIAAMLPPGGQAGGAPPGSAASPGPPPEKRPE